ncbi:hypothetical protein KFK09_000652 [Dendrobium nobile]|uniref:Uncharacterized protein n=1 Tax=Dendrobium nobile TaxID=94219 RepID=A0A8T3CFJ0_DENNO|nr:hypothetical protein KFK09_000652 [Dendrobium nobile]
MVLLKICLIKDKLKVIHDKQYFDAKHWAIEFQIGNFLYLKIMLMKGISRFDKDEKCVEPFEVIERIMAYDVRRL